MSRLKMSVGATRCHHSAWAHVTLGSLQQQIDSAVATHTKTNGCAGVVTSSSLKRSVSARCNSCTDCKVFFYYATVTLNIKYKLLVPGFYLSKNNKLAAFRPTVHWQSTLCTS